MPEAREPLEVDQIPVKYNNEEDSHSLSITTSFVTGGGEINSESEHSLHIAPKNGLPLPFNSHFFPVANTYLNSDAEYDTNPIYYHTDSEQTNTSMCLSNNMLDEISDLFRKYADGSFLTENAFIRSLQTVEPTLYVSECAKLFEIYDEKRQGCVPYNTVVTDLRENEGRGNIQAPILQFLSMKIAASSAGQHDLQSGFHFLVQSVRGIEILQRERAAWDQNKIMTVFKTAHRNNPTPEKLLKRESIAVMNLQRFQYEYRTRTSYMLGEVKSCKEAFETALNFMEEADDVTAEQISDIRDIRRFVQAIFANVQLLESHLLEFEGSMRLVAQRYIKGERQDKKRSADATLAEKRSAVQSMDEIQSQQMQEKITEWEKRLKQDDAAQQMKLSSEIDGSYLGRLQKWDGKVSRALHDMKHEMEELHETTTANIPGATKANLDAEGEGYTVDRWEFDDLLEKRKAVLDAIHDSLRSLVDGNYEKIMIEYPDADLVSMKYANVINQIWVLSLCAANLMRMLSVALWTCLVVEYYQWTQRRSDVEYKDPTFWIFSTPIFVISLHQLYKCLSQLCYLGTQPTDYTGLIFRPTPQGCFTINQSMCFMKMFSAETCCEHFILCTTFSMMYFFCIPTLFICDLRA